MSTEVARQILLFIIAPSCATTLLTIVAVFGVRDFIRSRRPGTRMGSWGEEWAWIGDLSGFQLQAETPVVLYHRCGWVRRLPEGEYLGNIVSDEALRHRDEGCANYPLSDARSLIPRHGRKRL